MCGSVIEGNPFLGAESDYFFFVKSLFSFDFKVVFVIEEDVSHDSPHIVYPVGVEPLHRPSCLGWWKAAEHKNFGISGKKWFQRVGFYWEVVVEICFFHFTKVIQIGVIYFEKCYLCISDF